MFIKKEKNNIIINLFSIKIKISLSIEKFIIKNFKKILPLLDVIIPKNPNKIVGHLVSKHENMIYSYFNYIENREPSLKQIFITKDDTTEIDKNENKHFFYTLKAIYEMYSAKYIVITHCAPPTLDYYKSKKHTYINLWHGMPIKTIGFTKEKSLSLKSNHGFIGANFKCFATSDIFKQLMISSFQANYHNVYITGLPRTDVIMNTTYNKNIENILGSKGKKTILYLPTFKMSVSNIHKKQIEKDFDNIFYLDDLKDNKDFDSFIEKNDIRFIMKPHPFEENFYKNNMNKLPKSDNFKIIFDSDLKSNDLDLYELFKFIDVMISDFSSVTVDYLILNKPVVYLNNLSKEYSKNRGMVLEDNYEILMPGDKVNTYSELKEKIIDALTVDSAKKLREQALPLLHKFRDNKASERIYEIMKNL